MVKAFVLDPAHLDLLLSCTSLEICAFQFCMWKMVVITLLTQPTISVINPNLWNVLKLYCVACLKIGLGKMSELLNHPDTKKGTFLVLPHFCLCSLTPSLVLALAFVWTPDNQINSPDKNRVHLCWLSSRITLIKDPSISRAIAWEGS